MNEVSSNSSFLPASPPPLGGPIIPSFFLYHNTPHPSTSLPSTSSAPDLWSTGTLTSSSSTSTPFWSDFTVMSSSPLVPPVNWYPEFTLFQNVGTSRYVPNSQFVPSIDTTFSHPLPSSQIPSANPLSHRSIEDWTPAQSGAEARFPSTVPLAAPQVSDPSGELS